jgi:hypothetical protein
MFIRNFWLDHIENAQGEVIQMGTPVNQQNLNRIELGVFEAHVANDLNSIIARLNKDEAANNAQVIIEQELTNNDLTTVAIPATAARNAATYTVTPVLAAFTGTAAPVFVVSALTTGSFKVQAVGGTFTALTLKLILQGGIL